MARNNEMTPVADMIEVMEEHTNKLRGKSFCITGHLCKPRKEIEKLISQAGGYIDKSVSRNTSYLITNEDWTKGTVDKQSSKYKEAKAKGVPIITEKQFFDMLTMGT